MRFPLVYHGADDRFPSLATSWLAGNDKPEPGAPVLIRSIQIIKKYRPLAEIF